MSIFCTSFELTDEEGFEDGRDGPAPIRYVASHLLPSPGDARAGSLDLGLIPGFITDNGWCVLGVDHVDPRKPHDECTCEPLTELPPVWPYLRVAVDDNGERAATVILDRSQVEKLRDALSDWLDRAVRG